MKKRLLALCLTVALLLGMMPVVSLASDTVSNTLDALLIESDVVLDGELSEDAWNNAAAYPFSVAEGITGAQVSALWSSTTVYLAVEYGAATAISLTLGSSSWQGLSLGASITGDGLTGCAKDGMAELAINLAAIGVVLEDYNESRFFSVSLSDEGGNNASMDAYLQFSGLQVTGEKYTPAISGDAVISATGENGFDYNSSADMGDVIDYTKTVQFSAKITVTTLDAFAGNAYVESGEPFKPYGLAFFLFRNTTTSTSKGNLYGGTIYNNGTSLIYRGYNGKEVDLEVKPGDPAFVLSYTLYPDGTGDISVDGVIKGSFKEDNLAKNIGVSTKRNVIHFRGYTPETGKTIEAKWESPSLTNYGEEQRTVAEDLSKETVLKDVALSNLMNGDTFNLPAAYETGVGTFDLTWTSDNACVVLAKESDVYKATVTQPNTKENATANLTMSAKRRGGSGAEKVTWDAQATVLGLSANITNIIMQLGADETKMNFTWFSASEDAGKVLFAKESQLVGGALPADAAVVDAERTESKKDGYYGNKATISGLEPGTTYYYQLKNGDTESDLSCFTTADAGSSFSFAFAGDPQIGRGYGSDTTQNVACIEDDGLNWQKTLDQMFSAEEFEGVDFLMSAGDQINTYLNSYEGHELQMDAFSNRDGLNTIPFVSVLGNHDAEPYSVYPFHFNQPNMLEKEGGGYYGETYTSSPSRYLKSADYYFVYHNVLFLVLNSDTFKAQNASGEEADKASALEHGEFVEKAIAATAGQDINWTIVLYHESPYGTSYHNKNDKNTDGTWARSEQYTFENMRKYLVPILYENGVDLVLSGHDHTYTRTHILKPDQEGGVYIDGSIVTSTYEEDADGNPCITNPDGILHITAATSSGSQVNPVAYTTDYTACSSKANTRQLIRIDVSETQLKLVNYNLGTASTEAITEIDTFTILKEAKLDEFSLSLKGVLDANFYVDWQGRNPDDYTVEIKIGDEIREVTGTVMEDGRTRFTAKLYYYEQGKVITATLKKGKEVVDTASRTVEQYADNLKSKYPEEAELIAVLNALEGYVEYGALYKNAQTAAADLTLETDVFEGKYPGSISKTGTDIEATLYLDEACDLRIKFPKAAFETYSVSIAGTYSDRSFSGNQAINSLREDGNFYVLDIEAILLQDWDETLTFTVTNETETITIEYSPMAYIRRQLTDGADEERTGLDNLLKAMYYYQIAGEAKFVKDNASA